MMARIAARLVLNVAILATGGFVGVAFAALQPGGDGGVVFGAVIGAAGAIVGGWLGAYLLRKADDQREKRREDQQVLTNRRATAGALVAIGSEAAGNMVDIGRFVEAGIGATTGLQDENFRRYHETLLGQLPAGVYYVIAGAFRQLSFARFHYTSGKEADELTEQDKDELDYVRKQAALVNALAQGVLMADYKDVAPELTDDPREGIKRYLPEPKKNAGQD